MPRRYGASLPGIHDAVVDTLDHLGRTIVSRDQTTFSVEVPVARIGILADDVTVTLSEENGTTVNVRSRSRGGRSDLGENRRHVVQLFRYSISSYKTEDLIYNMAGLLTA